MWIKFVSWSGLTQLKEVISLDSMLCPNVFPNLTTEDWNFNVQEDYKTSFFHNLDYVLTKVAGDKQVNVLALLQNPAEADVDSFNDLRFRFRGFDLLESDTGGISALVNCGGFAKAFYPTDLSVCGLLTDYGKALEVQRLLKTEYPDEHHADCDVWATWQMKREPAIHEKLS